MVAYEDIYVGCRVKVVDETPHDIEEEYRKFLGGEWTVTHLDENNGRDMYPVELENECYFQLDEIEYIVSKEEEKELEAPEKSVFEAFLSI